MTDQPKPAVSRLAGVLLIATAVVVTAAGIVFLALAAAAPQSGWFAYAPLSGQLFRPPNASIDLLRTLGFILIVLGVAVAAATLGVRVGRRWSGRRAADSAGPVSAAGPVGAAGVVGLVGALAAGGAPPPVRLQRSDRLTTQVEYAYSSTVAAGHELVFFAGACPLDATGAVGAPGDVIGQVQLCIQNLLIAMEDAGCRFENIASTRVLVASSHQPDLWAACSVVRDAFGTHDAPSTLLGVAALGYPGQLVELEAVAAR